MDEVAAAGCEKSGTSTNCKQWTGRPTHTEMTPTIAQLRPALIIVPFHCARYVAEELCNSYLMTRSRQDDVPALSFKEEQAIFTYAKLLDSHSLGIFMDRIIEEIIVIRSLSPGNHH